MQRKIYDFIQYKEDSHWWFKARKEIVMDVIKSYKNVPIDKCLDIGCGSGYFLSAFNEFCKECQGVEPYTYDNTKFENIIQCSAEHTPFVDKSFDVITMLDVLEHIKDEQPVLSEVKRLLKDDGVYLATVPACQWLYSKHDEENGHERRYSKKQLVDLFESAGFEVVKATYINSILFLPQAGIRLMEKKLNKEVVTEVTPSPTVNKILYNVFLSEKNLIRKMNLPIGLSLLIVAKKRCVTE